MSHRGRKRRESHLPIGPMLFCQSAAEHLPYPFSFVFSISYTSILGNGDSQCSADALTQPCGIEIYYYLLVTAKYDEGRASAQTFGRDVHPDARACCPPVFNNYTLKAPMDVASCSASSRARHLLHAHGCSLTLRFASCFAPVVRPWMQLRAPRLLLCPWIQLCALRLLPRTWRPLRPRAPPSPARPCRVCLWNTCNMKHLLPRTSETDETFTAYACNICV
jgi:hypothetical protein